jgi:uncharacterized protein (DUF1778 family)
MADKIATERLDFRVDPRCKQLIEQAAAVSGQTVSSFALATLLRQARKTLREERMLKLSARDGERLLAALESPPQPNEALRKLMRPDE